MLIVGVTGSLGSGKSTVAAMFQSLGACVVDADAIIKDLLAPQTKCIKKVAKIFPGVILNTGLLNRSELAKIVFKHPRELHKLTNILYPEALKVVKNQIVKFKGAPLIVLDVPLLFESGWDKITDINIVVKANQQQQMKRAKQHLGLTPSAVKQRLKHQMTMKEKCRRADIIIDNRHTLIQTRQQVVAIIHKLLKIKK